MKSSSLSATGELCDPAPPQPPLAFRQGGRTLGRNSSTRRTSLPLPTRPLQLLSPLSHLHLPPAAVPRLRNHSRPRRTPPRPHRRSLALQPPHHPPSPHSPALHRTPLPAAIRKPARTAPSSHPPTCAISTPLAIDSRNLHHHPQPSRLKAHTKRAAPA